MGERDRRTAEQWVRAAFEQAPWVVRWTARIAQRGLPQMQLAPRSAPGHIFGWRIRTSRPDVVHLEAQSTSAARCRRRTQGRPDRLVVSTYIFYDRPRAASVVWAVVAPAHRKVARYLLGRHAATAAGAGAGAGAGACHGGP